MNTDFEDYDEKCRHCGHGMYFEVGIGPLNCPQCGGLLTKPSQVPPNTSNDDVLLDADFISFDDIKAFRLIKKLNLLHLCLREHQ